MNSPPIRLPTVLLRHDLPDGTRHFDWMLAAEPDPDSPLVTFRVEERIDRGPPAFRAERLADHRRRYLDYEGPISGGRGRVSRVASGECTIRGLGDHEIDLLISLDRLEGPLRGIALGDDRALWRFSRPASHAG
ncbi:MAG: hypothetical protein AAFX79_05160 [Planctomycetota bacterium]